MSRTRRRAFKAIGYGLGTLVALFAALFVLGWWYLQASTPLLVGSVRVPFTGTPIRVDRDAGGVPLISSADRNQSAFALGFLHAQERFFQMDLARRIPAGELAELFGRGILEVDRGFRVHRFRESARRIVAQLPAPDRALLHAYIRGVNAGLGALRKPPAEYLLTGSLPVPWREEDTVLTVFYMYILLQDSQADQDFNAFLLQDTLGPAVTEFLAPLETEWDAPVLGTARVDLRMPARASLDLRGMHLERRAVAMNVEERFRGSNAWAVAGASTAHGGAMLANDMHLAFSIPNVFYRAAFQERDRSSRVLAGVTLPGFPCLIAGSNGDVAWGFSNSGADVVDLVQLDQRGLGADSYRTADGPERIGSVMERIHVRGDTDDLLTVHTTRFGPVLRRTRTGLSFAQLWVAHLPQAANFGLCSMSRAGSVAEALMLAPSVRIPAQNLVVADRAGHVGWTLAGGLPQRRAGAQRVPMLSSDAQAGWEGWLDAAAYPRALDPSVGRIWTANARVVSSAERPDYGFYMLGARAAQIRDDLGALHAATERDMLDVQCDDRALMMRRWRDLLIGEIARDGNLDKAIREQLLTTLRDWNGHASADSSAYWLIRTFRDNARQLILEPFVSAVVQRYGELDLDSVTDQLEQPLWQLVSAQPAHLLAPWFARWPDLTHLAIERTLRDAEISQVRARVPEWGSRNRLDMRHPMSRFVPLLGKLFDMPDSPLAGDLNMPLAQISGHGPVMRLAVSPGHEAAGLLTMPGGQAGNPLTPYYGAGHSKWLRGEPQPLLPGPTRYSLTLRPAG